MPVPFAALLRQYQTLKPEIEAALAKVLMSCAFIRGPQAEAFERAFAAHEGIPHVVGVANGTDALQLTLRALDIGPGDEVITPTNTFVATLGAIALTGATPVLVDCTPDTWLIEPAAVRQALSARTRAILPVHLYGQPADLDELAAIAREAGVPLIADGAQSHGATYRDQPVAAHPAVRATTYSFYPGKNLGAYGDAGAVATSDTELAATVRALGDHGFGTVKNQSDFVGTNSRLDGLQAAVLSVKLPHLAAWTARRQAIAARYREGLAELPSVALQVHAPERSHVWHLFVIEVANPAALAAWLAERGIQTGRHYPIPGHQQPAYRERARALPCPNAERHAERLLTLPIFAEQTDAEVEEVLAAVKAAPSILA